MPEFNPGDVAVLEGQLDSDPFVGRFELGYITCALWVGVMMPDGSDTPDWVKDVERLDRAAVEMLVSDCRDFILGNLFAIMQLAGEQSGKGITRADLFEQMGNDFWLTRNQHGAGFWDRGYGEVGEALTQACQPYGEQSLYVDHEGTIHVA